MYQEYSRIFGLRIHFYKNYSLNLSPNMVLIQWWWYVIYMMKRSLKYLHARLYEIENNYHNKFPYKGATKPLSRHISCSINSTWSSGWNANEENVYKTYNGQHLKLWWLRIGKVCLKKRKRLQVCITMNSQIARLEIKVLKNLMLCILPSRYLASLNA